MNEVSNVSDMAYGFRKVAEDISRIFNGDETINYPYAFGVLSTHFRLVLENLNLSEEQTIVLRKLLEKEMDRLYHVQGNYFDCGGWCDIESIGD